MKSNMPDFQGGGGGGGGAVGRHYTHKQSKKFASY
jgi:hypothetical protein